MSDPPGAHRGEAWRVLWVHLIENPGETHPIEGGELRFPIDMWQEKHEVAAQSAYLLSYRFPARMCQVVSLPNRSFPRIVPQARQNVEIHPQ